MLKSQKEDKSVTIFKDSIISRKQMSASREKLVKKNLIKENKGIFQINRGIMKRYVDQEEDFFLSYKAIGTIGEIWIWTTH